MVGTLISTVGICTILSASFILRVYAAKTRIWMGIMHIQAEFRWMKKTPVNLLVLNCLLS